MGSRADPCVKIEMLEVLNSGIRQARILRPVHQNTEPPVDALTPRQSNKGVHRDTQTAQWTLTGDTGAPRHAIVGTPGCTTFRTPAHIQYGSRCNHENPGSNVEHGIARVKIKYTNKTE